MNASTSTELSMEVLQEQAATLGIIAPVGDPHEKATWIAAIKETEGGEVVAESGGGDGARGNGEGGEVLADDEVAVPFEWPEDNLLEIILTKSEMVDVNAMRKGRIWV